MISREESYFIMLLSLALGNCFFEITQNFKFLAKDPFQKAACDSEDTIRNRQFMN
jgi:hypothetical protein